MTMSALPCTILLAGIAMMVSGCAVKPVEQDLLQFSRSLPTTLPEGAEELTEASARVVDAVQPELSGSKVSWRHPVSGVTINLYLGTAHAYPGRGNSSRLEVTAGNSSKGGIVVPSLLTKEWCNGRGSEVLPRVHFSPSGETALVEEDISDASPVYNNLLFVADTNSGRVEERILSLPRQRAALPYGIAANVLSITDEDVTLAFFPDKLYFKMRFDRIGDAERQLD